MAKPVDNYPRVFAHIWDIPELIHVEQLPWCREKLFCQYKEQYVFMFELKHTRVLDLRTIFLTSSSSLRRWSDGMRIGKAFGTYDLICETKYGAMRSIGPPQALRKKQRLPFGLRAAIAAARIAPSQMPPMAS